MVEGFSTLGDGGMQIARGAAHVIDPLVQRVVLGSIVTSWLACAAVQQVAKQVKHQNSSHRWMLVAVVCIFMFQWGRATAVDTTSFGIEPLSFPPYLDGESFETVVPAVAGLALGCLNVQGKLTGSIDIRTLQRCQQTTSSIGLVELMAVNKLSLLAVTETNLTTDSERSAI